MTKGNVLITGGSGQIGGKLTALLIEQGYSVSWMTRSPKNHPEVKQYAWDLNEMQMDESGLEDIDTIIHLAGAPINGKRWSPDVKNELRTSRIKSTQLLLETCKKTGIVPPQIIAGTAIGYYGYDSGGIWKKEESRFGDDFLATLTKEWEAAVHEFSKLGSKISILRTGIVLYPEGGALQEMSRPVKWGVGSPLAPGDQYVSWIHMEDEINAFLHVLENRLEGVYNLAAPEPVTNSVLMRSIAGTLKKPFFFPKVPAFAIRMLVGEMASAVTGSIRASSEKLRNTGFKFKFPEINSALEDLLLKKKK